jgi:hypothetical protein
MVRYLNKSVELSDALESEFIHQVDLVSKTAQMHFSNKAKHQRQRVRLRWQYLLSTYIQKANYRYWDKHTLSDRHTV